MKNCRIRHTYGEDDEEDANLLEEEAVSLASAALREGQASGTTLETNLSQVVSVPENASVTLGGKKCIWCGSNTHSCKTHKDCPHNPRNVANSVQDI